MKAVQSDAEPNGRLARSGGTVPKAEEVVKEKAEGSSASEEEQVPSLPPIWPKEALQSSIDGSRAEMKSLPTYPVLLCILELLEFFVRKICGFLLARHVSRKRKRQIKSIPSCI